MAISNPPSASGRTPCGRPASANVWPSRFLNPAIDSIVTAPTASRLPIMPRPNVVPSSSAQQTSSSGTGPPRSTSSGTTTPITPSYLPPVGTLSRCDPLSHTRSSMPIEAWRMNTFPAASTRCLHPAAAAWAIT